MKNPFAWRYRLVQSLLVILGVLIFAQLLRIQTTNLKDEIDLETSIYGWEWRTYFPSRGEIYDRNGHLLAGNITVYELGVDVTPEAVPSPHTIALALSVHLGLDYATVYNIITTPQYDYSVNPPIQLSYVIVANFVPREKAEELMALQISLEEAPGDPDDKELASLEGLYFKAHYQRSYPENSLASNVLGFVTQDNIGYGGIEGKYNSTLAGIPISAWVPTNPTLAEEIPDIEPGAILILTIDRDIQAATEKILDDAIDKSGAETGTIIVMDPNNGEILSMAVWPRMNINEYEQYDEIFPNGAPFNRAISQAYEPGSVVKILTMATGLETGKVVPTTIYTDSGIFMFHGLPFRNWNNTVWGQQDMTGCLEHSINGCLAWVATEIGTEQFYSYMQAFGLGHITGIDLAGEVSGRLKIPGDGDWSIYELVTNAYGQGVTITPIQMATAASAIANGGNIVYPHVVRTIVQSGHSKPTLPIVVSSPISFDSAQTLNEMLAISLDNETFHSLAEGFRVAGKTGTASIPTEFGYYDSEKTNASFVGWGPVDDPKFLIYIWLEKPQSSIWASEVAAPVFRDMVLKLVVMMDIPPDRVRHEIAER